MMTAVTDAPSFDLLIVGGGVNGAGIARDAAGRGLRVLLAEAGDLAGGTSSASTKLIHGGLRYLEQYEFRLVRESLIERERLLGIAPHIIWPLRFVLPQPEGGRPAWMIRAGLFLYDHLARRRSLPGSAAVRLDGRGLGNGLKPAITRGFAYSDCWVEDARLVVLNALDAARRGATIRTRTAVEALRREDSGWVATLHDRRTGRREEVRARLLVNAAGARVGELLRLSGCRNNCRDPRLVKGSHIVVPRLFEGAHAYIFQNPDGRIVFALPYEGAFTLIGTTDVPWTLEQGPPRIEAAEIDYLCASVNRYLQRQIAPADVVHSYSGVRPLFDDGTANASAVTRDYVLELDRDAALLSVFGGKITTYRRLAEHALEKLAPLLPGLPAGWTATAPLPGGDTGDFPVFLAMVRTRWPWLGDTLSLRLARSYGTRIADLIGDAGSPGDLGRHFGAGLHAREVDFLIDEEWALTAADLLWRRTKLGLHLTPDEAEAVASYLRRIRAREDVTA